MIVSAIFERIFKLQHKLADAPCPIKIRRITGEDFMRVINALLNRGFLLFHVALLTLLKNNIFSILKLVFFNDKEHLSMTFITFISELNQYI